MQKIFIFDKYFFIFYEIFDNFHKNECIKIIKDNYCDTNRWLNKKKYNFFLFNP